MLTIDGNMNRYPGYLLSICRYLGPPAMATPTQSWHRLPSASQNMADGLYPFDSHHFGMSHS